MIYMYIKRGLFRSLRALLFKGDLQMIFVSPAMHIRDSYVTITGGSGDDGIVIINISG